MRLVILLIFCLFLVQFGISLIHPPGFACPQARSKSTPRQKIRIRGDKPTIYVTLDRVGRRRPLLIGESEEGVWLRLHNNTRWAILLEANDAASKEYGDAELFYEVLEDNKTVVDMRCHACTITRLLPGKSILFSLPREYLEGNQIIRIGFNYAWERDERGSTSLEPSHYVYYYPTRLPTTSGPDGRSAPKAMRQRMSSKRQSIST